jgi:hypothetical protein
MVVESLVIERAFVTTPLLAPLIRWQTPTATDVRNPCTSRADESHLRRTYETIQQKRVLSAYTLLVPESGYVDRVQLSRRSTFPKSHTI